MADRTSAALFSDIFGLAEYVPKGSKREEFAGRFWKLTRDYDFSSYQMGCDEVLLELGLARRGVHADYQRTARSCSMGQRETLMIDEAVIIVTCKRCQAPCKVSQDRNPDAKVLRYAGEGLCAGCAATEFLLGVPVIAMLLERQGPQVLLNPMMAPQFTSILESGPSDADGSEINRETVVAQWDLPFPKVRRKHG